MNKPIATLRKTTFAKPDTMPGALSAGVAASLLAAVGDVTFILSADGTILDIAVSQGDLANHGFADWVGGAWIDTVTDESKPKVVEMLSAATETDGTPRWRQVNHPAAGGDVPVRYLVMTLGENDRLIAIGRDMRSAAAVQQRLLQTQQSLERDYIRMRQAEARYRLLFDMASEPVLIVDAQTRHIREANPAAHRLLDLADNALVGKPVDVVVAKQDRDAFVAFLGGAEVADDLAPVTLKLSDEHGDARISARPCGSRRSCCCNPGPPPRGEQRSGRGEKRARQATRRRGRP